MVTLQILVLSFLVRVRVSQLSKAYSSRIGFFRIWKVLLKNVRAHIIGGQSENSVASNKPMHTVLLI